MGEHPTRHVRLSADLAQTLALVAEVKGVTVAELLDPVVRPQADAWRDECKAAIRALQKARAAAHDIGGES